MFSLLMLALSLAASAAPADDTRTSEPPPEPPAEAPHAPAPAEIAGWLNSVVLLQIGPAWCSGVVIDAQGTVATAYHCVASGRKPKVILKDGRSYIGESAAVWPAEDLALISAPALASDPAPVQPLAIRDTPPQVGERIYGLGHPYAPLSDRSPLLEGTLRWSVTGGLVSNSGTHFLQTDAALNPGNSGGPVVDGSGEVLGIVSRKLKGENLAFAANNTHLNQLVSEREQRAPSPLGGTLGLSIGLATLAESSGALTGQVRGDVSFRDRVILSVAGGLPYSARTIAEAWGSSEYPLADLSLGYRARLGRGTFSTALEAGAVAELLGGYTFDETLQVALIADPVFAPGVYARLDLAGVGLRLAALRRSDEILTMLTIEIDAPGVLTTF